MRINKFLSQCGVASRRGADQLVLDKKVSVNGKVLTGFVDIDPNTDIIKVNGKIITGTQEFVYLALHKPKGCITSVSDDKGRKTVMDFVPKNLRNLVKPVGRLDYDTEGLLILTNDGDFARMLTLPANQVTKVYVAKVEGEVTNDELKKLREGVTLDDGHFAQPKSVKILSVEKNRPTASDPEFALTSIEVVLTEGKNREVRRIFDTIGKKVAFLKRTQIGKLKLGGLSRGKTKTFDPRLFR